jgi:hypothetical protein
MTRWGEMFHLPHQPKTSGRISKVTGRKQIFAPKKKKATMILKMP